MSSQPSTTSAPTHRYALLGNSSNFWLYSSEHGFDLTHPPKPSACPILPRLKISTTNPSTPITVDPSKSALVIIDMQNFFLSPAFGRSPTDENGNPTPGHAALDRLVDEAIPAARKAGVRVVWLNWGLTQEEVDSAPPAMKRSFGFQAEVGGGTVLVDRHGDPRIPTNTDTKSQANGVGEAGGVIGGASTEEQRKAFLADGSIAGKKYAQIGEECGFLPDQISGDKVDAGKMLMRDQWNTALYHPLDGIFEEGRKLETRPDVWVHKNRMSGLAGAKSACEEFLEKEGIRTLFFAGVNTDQCVGGSLQDAYTKGYDCIMLRDACGTTSPGYAQQCMEFNSGNSWGFVTTCKDFAEGVANIKEW